MVDFDLVSPFSCHHRPVFPVMRTRFQALIQGLHKRIQEGVHQLHFKHGAFETEIRVNDEIEHADELLDELDILAQSKLCSSAEKRGFRDVAQKINELKTADKSHRCHAPEDTLEEDDEQLGADIIQKLVDTFKIYFLRQGLFSVVDRLRH
jgi:hypothetical protein